MTRHVQTLVVGAGPAGIAAATRAAESGHQVTLLDDNPTPGGQIWRALRNTSQPDTTHSPLAARWTSRLLATSTERLQGWSVFDQPAPGTLRTECDGRLLDLTCDNLILATGARERFLPFPGWTLPNIFGVGGLQAMMKAGLPVRGKRIVLAGSGPLLLSVAAALKRAGAHVVCIAEQAPLARLAPFALSLISQPRKILQGLGYRLTTLGIPFHTGCWPVEAQGDTAIRSVVLAHGRGRRQEISCDYLACSFHLVPNTELPSLLGCRLEHGFVQVDPLQQTSLPSTFCAGEPTGIGGLELSLLEGEIAGLAAAACYAEATRLSHRRTALLRFARRLQRTFALRQELRSLAQPETIVCRCEDVPFAALLPHTSWRGAKLHTRCGMGPCQGRICASATHLLFGWPDTTLAQSVRPPLIPVRIASLLTASPAPHLDITEKQELP